MYERIVPPLEFSPFVQSRETRYRSLWTPPNIHRSTVRHYTTSVVSNYIVHITSTTHSMSVYGGEYSGAIMDDMQIG